ncbi:hypothetical protein [Flagellimonas sp.]|uniref:FEKKY domain-containing protein n=1 Tax=Flagellimonas sp. TaxID=2058762 RepID=UPI003BB02A56
MKNYLLVLCFLTSMSLCSQNGVTLSGKVISEEGEIPNAYVTIGTQGTITDQGGNFKFEYLAESMPDILRVKVSSMGYTDHEFDYPSKQTDLNNLVITLSLYPKIDGTTAIEDINNGKVQFLLSGGIAPTIYSTDRKFTRKYGVDFYEFGCQVISMKSLQLYNSEVAKYLDNKYGKKWRSEVRDDLVGIN